MDTQLCPLPRKDKIQNDYIRDIGMAPIEEKITGNQLRWFGHKQRRLPEALMKKYIA